MTDQQMLEFFLWIWGITLVVSLILVVVSYVVMGFALGSFFGRVGVERWKAWVPFYNYFCWLRLGGQSGHWMWAMLVPYGSLLTWIFLYIGMHKSGIAFGKEAGFLVLGIFLPFVWLFMLGYGSAEYHPERIAARGYPPPSIGHGAVPAG